MKIRRIGRPVRWDGVPVATGDIIDVPADIARSLLTAGHTADGAPVCPQWQKISKAAQADDIKETS
ncbi:MAG: hypothetical protein GY925_18890 [Actinomycetia bacterium]|nr:hypothetical protein [Actinomycetes bacterium]